MSHYFIECRICGLHYYRITESHCKTHGITLLDYQINFPDAPLLSEQQTEDIGYKIRAYCATEEGKETKRRVVAKRMADPNDGYFSSEVISQRNRDNWANPEFNERVGNAISKAKSTPEQHKQISETSRRNWEDPYYVKQVKEGRKGIGFGEISRPNSDESLLLGLLNRINPGLWLYNSGDKRIGRKIPDFVHTSKKKLIEYFGINWHIPVIDDQYLTEYYKEQGYEVLIVWDSELLNYSNWDKLEEKIINYEHAEI